VVQTVDSFHQLAGQASDGAGEFSELVAESIEGSMAAERSRWWFSTGVELVEVRPEPILGSGSFLDEIFPVVQQEAELPLRPIEVRSWEVGFADRGAGHGQRVDRVGLASLTTRPTAECHEPRCHPDHCLTGPEERALESPGELPAVFDGPRSGGPLRGPSQGFQVTCVNRPNGHPFKLTSVGIGCDDCVRRLVRIDTEHDHDQPPRVESVADRSVDTSVEDFTSSYQVTPDDPLMERAADR
jgi:hypothetical protein